MLGKLGDLIWQWSTAWFAAAGQDKNMTSIPRFKSEVINNNASAYTRGSEIIVNQNTGGDQTRPAAAALKNNNYFVVWNGPDSDGLGIFARQVSVSGALVGNEASVNLDETRDQYEPAVAGLSNGGAVIAWTDYRSSPSETDIYFQLFNASVLPQGGNEQVNSGVVSGNFNYDPNVAAFKHGGFIITWHCQPNICGQRYYNNAATDGAEFQVNTYTTADRYAPKAAELANADSVIVWTSEIQDGDGAGVFGQRYDAQGNALGGEFPVNTFTAFGQAHPAVAPLDNGDGGFVTAWMSPHEQGNTSLGVYMQRFDGSSSKLGQETHVNEDYVQLAQDFPALVTLDQSAGYVVSWYDQGAFSTSNISVAARHFETFGASVTNVYPVAECVPTPSFETHPAMAALSSSHYIIVYQCGNGAVHNIYARVYTNAIPTVSSIPKDQTFNADEPFNFGLAGDTFSDADTNQVLSVSALMANGDSLPDGLRFNSDTLAFSGQIAANTVKSFGLQDGQKIKVRADDGFGGTADTTFMLKIKSDASTSNVALVVGLSVGLSAAACAVGLFAYKKYNGNESVKSKHLDENSPSNFDAGDFELN